MRRFGAILWFYAALCMLTGCATLPDSSPLHASAVPDLQSSDERNMVVLFGAMLEMDKREGLAISKRQAEQLLPLVKRCMKDGEVLTGEYRQFLDIWNPSQKAFYDQYLEHFQQHLNESRLNEPGTALSAAERHRLVEQFERMRAANRSNGAELRESGQEADELAGKNVEQQLIEILMNKK